MKEKKYYYIDKLISTIILDKNLSDKSKLLFGIINSFSKNIHGYCYLNYRQLAEMLGIQKRSLYIYIKQLEKGGYIKKIKQQTHTYLKPIRDLELEIIGEEQNKKINKDQFYYDWLNETED